MTTLNEWQNAVRGVFKEIGNHANPYTIEILGINLEIYPEVFSPKYFTDSAWFAKILPSIIGKSKLLEIGTGTGLIALLSALNGAEVTATDINPQAVLNAKKNFKNYNLNIPTYLGSVYDSLDESQKFDYIFWNHPFNYGTDPDETVLLKAGFDFKYESLEKYIAEAKNHLMPSGKLLLGTGNYADLERINEIASSHHYSLKLLTKEIFPISENHTITNDYRIYEFIEL